MQDKPRFVMCNCTGECPGFEKVDFWGLLNYIRNELDVAYAVIHPQLCVDDGERFFDDLLQHDVTYIIGACDPRMQKKMFRDSFDKNEFDFDRQVVPLDLRNMTTEEAMAKVKEAVEKLRQ
ncbi:MAG: hypothetical protein ONB05_08455 [candidate division KSB1 bacterium]|nr:hypothetical protein [candidate division KSB1 bacterium]